jgi:hypothetical protein
MLSSETTLVGCEGHTEHANVLGGQNEFLVLVLPVAGVHTQAAFEGGKWGERPRPRS